MESPVATQFEVRSIRKPGVLLTVPIRDLCHTCKTDLKHFLDLSLDSFIVKLNEFYKDILKESIGGTDEEISEEIKTLKGLGYL